MAPGTQAMGVVPAFHALGWPAGEMTCWCLLIQQRKLMGSSAVGDTTEVFFSVQIVLCFFVCLLVSDVFWMYDDVGVSENSVPLNPMVNDHYPYEKWLFHWEYTLFSDKPMYGHEPLGLVFLVAAMQRTIFGLLWLGALRMGSPPADWGVRKKIIQDHWKWWFIVENHRKMVV